MATLYQQLRTDGCIHFDDLLIYIDCDPKRKSAISVRLRNLVDKPMEGDEGGSILEQCNSINKCRAATRHASLGAPGQRRRKVPKMLLEDTRCFIQSAYARG